jgi:hypothetical protein
VERREGVAGPPEGGGGCSRNTLVSHSPLLVNGRIYNGKDSSMIQSKVRTEQDGSQ